jgi:hypothetical protein
LFTLARIASHELRLAGQGDRDCVGEELAVLIQHLLSERQGSVQELIEIGLRLLGRGVAP